MKEPAAKNRNHPIVSFSFPITSQFTTAKNNRKKSNRVKSCAPERQKKITNSSSSKQASKQAKTKRYLQPLQQTIIINSIISPEPKYVNDFSI